MPRIVTVVGARPQFIKAAVVSRALAARPDMEEILVHTGQHYDENMSEVFFRELGIPAPRHHLHVGSGPQGEQTGKMLAAIEAVLLREQPDAMLVYGDTNSTLAGALAAAKLHIPVVHVEAGLRSFNRAMPEEVNRVLTDHLSHLLLAPTGAAVTNLRREGLPEERISLVGDVMYDGALHYARQAEQHSDALHRLSLTAGGFILATIHRAENTDHPARLRAAFDGLAAASRVIPVVLPLHPRTRKMLSQAGHSGPAHDKLRLVDPLGYLDMVQLEQAARLIVTDSGGVQKEAFFHGVPCVTLRDETEWTELVELGWNRLAPPTSAAQVTAAIDQALQSPTPARPRDPLYGGGHAAERIVDLLAGLDRRSKAA